MVKGTGIPNEVMLLLQKSAGLSTFIETGAYKCWTTVWAADHFAQVYTIEACPPLYEAAIRAYADLNNVTFLFGDSRAELAQVLQKAQQPALILLDAHWIGDRIASAKVPGGECPLREELLAINASMVAHYILIHDARLFVQGPPPPHDPAQWPTWAEVQELLGDRAVRVFADTIIAIPKGDAASNVALSDYVAGDSPCI